MEKKLITFSKILLIIFFITSYIFIKINSFAYDKGFFPDSEIGVTIQAPPEYQYAYDLFMMGYYGKAIEEFRKVVNMYPGTPLAAESQYIIALLYCKLGKRQEDIQELQSIIQRYPGTKYWLRARGALIDLTYLKDSPTIWVEETNKLILEIGGKSVFQILNLKEDDETEKAKIDLSKVKPQFRLILAHMYSDIASTFEEQNKRDEAIKLYIFVRENFPKFTVINIVDQIARIILESKGILDPSYFPSDFTPPVIEPIAPRENLSIGDKRPKIEFLTYDGDISQFQVNLSQIEFTLDGIDLTEKIKVKTSINRSAQIGPVFEKIRITHKPEKNLSSGAHTVFVKVPDWSGKTSAKTWSFTIKEEPPRKK